jgi:hypothetical protein
MRARTTEPKHTFSIQLPAPLYQKIVSKAGRGNIGAFINQVLEKELNSEEEQLKQQLIKGYQAQAKSERLQKELKAMEGTQFKDLKDE